MSADLRGTRPWDQPGWQEAASAWITEVLEQRGAVVSGPIERVRTRFWSVHLGVTTDAGRFWFKENCPAQAFEARLVEALRPVAGDLMGEVTATDAAAGWLLTPDQGVPVRDAEPPPDVGTYERLLTSWGTLQRRVLASGIDLPGCGLTTLTPEGAADYLLRQVDRLNRLPRGDVGRMDDATAARLRALVPTVHGWVDTVSATGLPVGLDHADLHLGNAFGDPARGPLRIFDFSDAVVGWPLCTLLVPLRLLTRGDDGHPGEPAAARVVEAYLETFDDLVPRRELRAAVPAALELAKLHRFESWRRALDGADAASYREFGAVPAAWLNLLGQPDELLAAP